jgi:hypothetical protein
MEHLRPGRKPDPGPPASGRGLAQCHVKLAETLEIYRSRAAAGIGSACGLGTSPWELVRTSYGRFVWASFFLWLGRIIRPFAWIKSEMPLGGLEGNKIRKYRKRQRPPGVFPLPFFLDKD